MNNLRARTQVKVMRVGSLVPGPPLILPAAGNGVYGGFVPAGRTDATSKLSGAGVCARQTPVTMAAKINLVMKPVYVGICGRNG